MKITRIERIPVAVPYREKVRDAIDLCRQKTFQVMKMVYKNQLPCTIYKVYTDEGLVGVAEARIEPNVSLEQYIGKSPFELLQAEESGYLLMAFYDLAGQYLGVPAHRLMGKQIRQKVETPFWSHAFTPKLLEEETLFAIEHGYTVHKIKARPFEDPIEQIKAVAAVAPKDYQVIIDPNQCWNSVAKTYEICSVYREKYPLVKCIEEPFSRWNMEACDLFRNRLPEFDLAIHAWDDIVQTEMQAAHCDHMVLETTNIGRSLWDVAAVARAHGTDVWLEYGLRSGISAAFQLHQAAVMPEAACSITLIDVQEDDLITESFCIQNGLCDVPTKPGLGITLDEEALHRYRIDS